MFDWIFLPRENPCAKFYIIIIIIKGTGVGQVGPQPTPGTSTTPPTRVWGDTFGKCL